MKIALLTIWKEKNYGAEMQAYATIKALKQMGHSVVMINYLLGELEHPTVKQRIIRFISSFCRDTKKFNRFWKKYIPTTCHYHTFSELKNNPPQADYYIVGSDQVWNPEITKDKAATYFLDFGNEHTKRISYASSFGEKEWNAPEELTAIAKKRLQSFSAVSCREADGVNILQNTFNIDAVNVVDPTLLHDRYPELTGPIIQRKTLAFYPLSPFPELESFCKELADNLGLEYNNINKKKYLVRRIVWDRPSIEEWVKSIAEADLVVTPSFHGLAFSLIYQRQFIIIQNPDGKGKSSRITNLLASLGLSNRFFTSIEEANRARVWEQPIDYSIVQPKLKQLRDYSLDFLKHSIR